MYSQNNEDTIIVDILKGQTGMLWDIGANDGKLFSNSLALIESGWEALMVEPASSAFSKLVETHGGNNKVKLLNAAISDCDAIVPFYQSEFDQLSTLQYKHVDQWNSAATFKQIYIRPVTMQQIINTFGTKDLRYITLDVEGNNYELFTQLPFWVETLSCICVEHEMKFEAFKRLAQRYGFRMHTETIENFIFIR